MRKRYLLLFFISSPFLAYSQFSSTLDRDFLLPYQQALNNKNCSVFTSVMPYSRADLQKIPSADSVGYKDLIFRNKKNLFEGKNFQGNIYPLFGAEAGNDGYASKKVFSYYGGIHTDGTIGKKFSYSVNYMGGYLNGPSYVDSIIKQYKVVPGMGYAYGSAANGYSYQYWDAYINYSLNRVFDFEVGKGKQFWGDGYRSLFLSDASNSYPYFKITTTIWHIQYVNLFTVMQDVEAPGGLQKDFTLKYGSFHYLSWNASRRINFGLFEAVIWKGNQGNDVRSFDPNYLNPVIFYRPVEFSLGSPDNVLVGGSFKVKVAKNGQFYGQLLLDEFVLHNVLAHNGWWGNKQGVQGGFKELQLFGAKGLSFQTEFDYVRPYTYSHGNPQENYSNFGQPLADPEGANFAEWASFITWFHKNLLIEGNLVVYYYGADPAGEDYGQDIFITYNDRLNDYGNYVGQGTHVYLGTIGLRGAYVISPKMGMKAEMGASERFERKGTTNISSPYIYIGVKTSLGNLYNDF